MLKINIYEAKVRLSNLIDRVAEGETVFICHRNRPVAELVAIQPRRTEVRSLGLAPGSAELTPAFFEPLPDELVAAFEGRDPAAYERRARGPLLASETGPAARQRPRSPARPGRSVTGRRRRR